MGQKIFISHRNDKKSNAIGAELGEFLSVDEGHTVFFDKTYLQGGMTWQQEIINELLSSDVVIVILNKGTAESHWVQREIDMARAQNISILPVTLHEEISEIEDALERFDLHSTQFIHLELLGKNAIDATYQKIAGRIEPLSEETVANQKDMLDALQLRLNPPVEAPKKTPSRRNSHAVLFTHPDAYGLTFAIATGDASRLREYEVLVNTENNYMQMARFYQTNTLSYGIRRNGAYMDGEILLEDTIQNELYDNAYRRGLPVPARTVLATSAGHPQSVMRRQTDYRYVLHAAAVRFDYDKTPANQPVSNLGQLIENCLDSVDKIDANNGEIQGKNGIIVPSDDNYKPLRSILFPAFGAGEGGKPYKRAVEDIVSIFARDVPVCIKAMGLSINKVGFSVYFQEDIEEITNIFFKHGFEEIAE